MFHCVIWKGAEVARKALVFGAEKYTEIKNIVLKEKMTLSSTNSFENILSMSSPPRVKKNEAQKQTFLYFFGQFPYLLKNIINKRFYSTDAGRRTSIYWGSVPFGDRFTCTCAELQHLPFHRLQSVSPCAIFIGFSVKESTKSLKHNSVLNLFISHFA